MNEIKKILKKLRKAKKDKDLGPSGAGFMENKVYNAEDARTLLFCLFENIAIELGIKINSQKLKEEIFDKVI